MSSKIAKIIVLVLVIFAICQEIQAQKRYSSRRWRLRFAMEKDQNGKQIPPKPFVVTAPDGTKEVYWYFRYKIFNDTGRDIPYSVNIKLVIDKSQEGIPESKVPGLFYKARIPSDVEDKETYIRSLRTYHDIDLPIVKREILSRLGIYPKLSAVDRKVLETLPLPSGSPKSIADVMNETNLSFAEAELALNRLVVRNLVLSQETAGSPVFIKGTIQKATFLVDGKEVVKEKGNDIAGWEIVDFDRDFLIVKKGEMMTTLGIGSAIEFLYTRSGKTPDENESNPPLFNGMSAKGTYKGKIDQGKQQYAFDKGVIRKGQVIHGFALFAGVSPEVDFMAIVISGLIDPIVRRYKAVYAYNEVLMLGYETLGDEYSILKQDLTPLYEDWQVLSTKVVRKYGQ